MTAGAPAAGIVAAIVLAADAGITVGVATDPPIIGAAFDTVIGVACVAARDNVEIAGVEVAGRGVPADTTEAALCVDTGVA